MPQPQWSPLVPAEVRCAAEPHIERWSALVPGWVEDFRIEWQSNLQYICQVNLHYTNRWAVLRIGPSWLSESETEREACMVHELVHILMEPLADASTAIMEETCAEGSDAGRMARRSLTRGLEASTEDTARAIIRAVRGGA